MLLPKVLPVPHRLKLWIFISFKRLCVYSLKVQKEINRFGLFGHVTEAVIRAGYQQKNIYQLDYQGL